MRIYPLPPAAIRFFGRPGAAAVAWPAGNLSALGGRTVRFKINFEKDTAADPRLFEVYLRAN